MTLLSFPSFGVCYSGIESGNGIEMGHRRRTSVGTEGGVVVSEGKCGMVSIILI